jgi:anti-sigma B factor antagonist
MNSLTRGEPILPSTCRMPPMRMRLASMTADGSADILSRRRDSAKRILRRRHSKGMFFQQPFSSWSIVTGFVGLRSNGCSGQCSLDLITSVPFTRRPHGRKFDSCFRIADRGLKSPEQILVRCSGRITAVTSANLQTTVQNIIPQTKRVALDLTDVSYMDSSGLGAIVGIYLSARRQECELKLINLNQRPKELFRLTNLAKIFEGHEDMLGMTPD